MDAWNVWIDVDNVPVNDSNELLNKFVNVVSSLVNVNKFAVFALSLVVNVDILL